MKNRIVKSITAFCAFIGAFLVYHIIGSNFFPVDENNVLQAPNWYPLLGMLIAGVVAYIAVKHRGEGTQKPATKRVVSSKESQQQELPLPKIAHKVEEEAKPALHTAVIPEIVREPDRPTVKSGKRSQPVSKFDPHTQVRTDTYTVYYAYGHVAKVFPPPVGSYYDNRDIIYSATCIVSDGIVYDLTDERSIRSIKTPNYHIYAPNKVGEELGVTGCLDYVLRMRSGQYWGEGKFDLAIACLEKATELMKYSSVGWPPKDFFRIVNELNDLGRFKKAQKWKNWIERNIPGAISSLTPITTTIDLREPISTEERKSLIEECKYLDTDLVEVSNSGVCCEVCAKYRNRIYTLTGKDLRFPKLPKDFHKSCGLSIYPYIWGVSEPTFACQDPIAYSNRPFVDDRTEEDIERRNKWLNDLSKQPEIIRTPNLTRIIYYRLVQDFPELAPKSLSGFSRMRNANSKNYQALVKKAEAAGFVFPATLEDVAKWEG